MSDDPHAGIEFVCREAITDDDGDPLTEEREDENGATFEVVKRCDATVTWDDHGTFVRSPPRELGYDMGALRFQCPSCGEIHWRCPVCTDPDDNSPPGWFRGDSTGKMMACNNCNQQEYARELQEPDWR